MGTYEVQYQSGSTWYSVGSYGSEQGALIQGEMISRSNPSRRYRMVLCENGRKSTVHIF